MLFYPWKATVFSILVRLIQIRSESFCDINEATRRWKRTTCNIGGMISSSMVSGIVDWRRLSITEKRSALDSTLIDLTLLSLSLSLSLSFSPRYGKRTSDNWQRSWSFLNSPRVFLLPGKEDRSSPQVYCGGSGCRRVGDKNEPIECFIFGHRRRVITRHFVATADRR